MEAECSLLCSQERGTGPYPEPGILWTPLYRIYFMRSAWI